MSPVRSLTLLAAGLAVALRRRLAAYAAPRRRGNARDQSGRD